MQFPCLSRLANVFCSYGGLVDVLEVRVALTAAGNKLQHILIPYSVCAQQLNFRSGQTQRNSFRQRCRRGGRQVRAAAKNGTVIWLLRAPLQPAVRTRRLTITCSLVGQIAKNVYQCTVIGSCRARKCAIPAPCLNCIATGCVAFTFLLAPFASIVRRQVKLFELTHQLQMRGCSCSRVRRCHRLHAIRRERECRSGIQIEAQRARA